MNSSLMFTGFDERKLPPSEASASVHVHQQVIYVFIYIYLQGYMEETVVFQSALTLSHRVVIQ